MRRFVTCSSTSFMPVFDGLRGGLLQVGIEGGVNAVRLIVQFALVELVDQRVANQIDKVGRIAGFHIGRSEFQGRGFCLLRLFPGDGMGFDHAVEHKIAAFQRALRMPIRRQITGSLNDSGQQRGFRQA